MANIGSFFRITIGAKIGIGFAAVALVLAVTVGLTITKVDETNIVTNRLIELRTPTSQASLNMLNGINHSLAALRGWIILGKDKFKDERYNAWASSIEPSLALMKNFSVNWTDPENVKRMKIIGNELQKFERYQEQIEDIAQTIENQPAMKILLQEASPQGDILFAEITKIIDIELMLPATPERKELLGIMADVRGTTGAGLANIRAYLLSGDKQFVKKFDLLWTKNTRRNIDLSTREYMLNDAQKSSFKNFNRARKLFSQLPNKMFEIRGNDSWNIANDLLGTKAAPSAFKIKKQLEGMIVSQKNLMEQDSSKAQLLSEQLIKSLWMLLLAGVSLASIIGFAIARLITKPIQTMVKTLNSVAAGDLTVEIESTSKDEIGELLNSTKKMVEKLREIVGDVNKGSSYVSTGAQELSLASQMLSSGTSEQAASLEQISASMQQMAANIHRSSDNAEETKKIALQTSKDAQEGGEAVSNAVDAMKKIANTTSAVEEIARQINLLALNAAIEAAHAGEHGKGFAVVAEQVKKLAQESKNAASEITHLSANSVKVAGRAGQLLASIVPDIRKTAELVQEISASTHELSVGAEQIHSAIQILDKTVQKGSTSSDEVSNTAEGYQNKLLICALPLASSK